MVDLGYDTRNPMLILKTLLLFQILYVIQLIYLFAVLYPLKRYLKGTYKDYWRGKYKKLFR